MTQPRDYQDKAKLIAQARKAIVKMAIEKSPVTTQKGLQNSLSEIRELVQTSKISSTLHRLGKARTKPLLRKGSF